MQSPIFLGGMKMAHGILILPGFTAQHSLERDKPLYRIFSFERFCKLLVDRRIYFRNVVKWEDTYEYPIRFMPEDRKDFLQRGLYGLCLTKAYDKEPMWKLYSGKNLNGVCIRTTAEAICNSLQLFDYTDGVCWKTAFIGNVKYVSYLDDNPTQMFYEPDRFEYPDYLYPAYIKRKEFSYEEEVRIMLYNGDPIKLNSDGQLFGVKSLDFIHEVILSPYASKEDIALLEAICMAFGVKVSVRQSDFLNKIKENSFPLPPEQNLYWGQAKHGYNILDS